MRIKMMKHEPISSSSEEASISICGDMRARTCRILRIIGTIVVCALILVARPALAQMSAIVGTVSDPSDAILPGASVQAVNINNGATRTTNSSTNGVFALSDQPYIDYLMWALWNNVNPYVGGLVRANGDDKNEGLGRGAFGKRSRLSNHKAIAPLSPGSARVTA